jgi:hypothetical protein
MGDVRLNRSGYTRTVPSRIPVLHRPASDQFFVCCLPFRGHDAEENEVSCPGISDELLPATRDENDLPVMYRRGPGADVHLAGSFEDIIEFRGISQDMGQGRLAGRDDRVGNAAAEPLCTGHLVGMEELCKK